MDIFCIYKNKESCFFKKKTVLLFSCVYFNHNFPLLKLLLGPPHLHQLHILSFSFSLKKKNKTKKKMKKHTQPSTPEKHSTETTIYKQKIIVVV